MKQNYLFILVILGMLVYGCKSGTQGEATDTSAVLEEDTAASEEMAMAAGGMMGLMHQSMMQVDTMKMTGDPDYDFARMMSAHHKGGMAMIEEEITHTTDTVFKKFANQIKEEQQKDQQELQKFISGKPGQSNSEFMEEMRDHMKKARDEMNNMKMTGNTDKDFAALLSIHHKHGIDMAKTEVKYGKNAQLKSLAQQMADKQEKERKQLDDMKK